MKYMDSIQTADKAIEWLQKYQRVTVEPIDGAFYRIIQDGRVVVEWCSAALINQVNASQWARYAGQLSSALTRVSGEASVAELDRVWELCNAE